MLHVPVKLSLNDSLHFISEEWLFISKKNPHLIFDRRRNPTLEGISLFDALVFRNWLTFAKLIGDKSYKKVSSKIYYSKYVEESLKFKQNNR